MSYYYGSQHHQPLPSSHSTSLHNHHGGRSRRAPRLSNSQNSHRQFRGVRSMKDLSESPPVSAFRLRFEAGRSFDLDDDIEFCPGLLTEDEVSISKPDCLLWSSGVSIEVVANTTPSVAIYPLVFLRRVPIQRVSAVFSFATTDPTQPGGHTCLLFVVYFEQPHLCNRLPFKQ